MTAPISAEACCSSSYESAWLRALSEDIFHPGGAGLTHRTVAALGLSRGERLLDIGCGLARTTKQAAAEGGFTLIGLDLSHRNLLEARQGRVEQPAAFVVGDAHRLPFCDGAFDGAICECVLSLFADKQAALAEIHRVVKHGGRVGISDVCTNWDLPEDLVDAAAEWTCLTGALSRDRYVDLFGITQFDVAVLANETDEILELIRDVKRRLVALAAAGVAAGKPPTDLKTIRYWLDRIKTEVNSGSIEYLRFECIRV
ncbi:MAG: methyltransferase domain-containing protein [Gammaproteobacteria bacterium]|jgi:SAM-dependent methyltransferase